MTSDEWKHRAEREAAAIVAGCDGGYVSPYDAVVGMIAVGWLQGYSVGTHETMGEAERAFQKLREELTA